MTEPKWRDWRENDVDHDHDALFSAPRNSGSKQARNLTARPTTVKLGKLLSVNHACNTDSHFGAYAVNAGGKMHRFSGAKIHQWSWLVTQIKWSFAKHTNTRERV
jgi:hypothetical protein